LFYKYAAIKCRFRGPVVRQPALPWQPFSVLLVGDHPYVNPQVWSWYDYPVLSYYIFSWIPSDLDFWPFDLGVMSRDATWVINPCTKFELVIRLLTVPELRLKFAIDRKFKVPIFTFFGRGTVKGSNFNFHLSNPQKALPWRKLRIMTYCGWGCVQKCDLWAWRRNEKKDRNCLLRKLTSIIRIRVCFSRSNMTKNLALLACSRLVYNSLRRWQYLYVNKQMEAGVFFPKNMKKMEKKHCRKCCSIWLFKIVKDAECLVLFLLFVHPISTWATCER